MDLKLKSDAFREALRGVLRNKAGTGDQVAPMGAAPMGAAPMEEADISDIPAAPINAVDPNDTLAAVEAGGNPNAVPGSEAPVSPEAEMILSELEQFIVSKANSAQGEPRVMLNILHNFLWENKAKIAQKMAKGIGK